MKREFRNILGSSMMSWTYAICQALFTSFITFYITDYLCERNVKYGVMIVATVLPILKVIDACTDILQGWIVDNIVGRGKAKYKTFCKTGILLMTVSALVMFTFSNLISPGMLLIIVIIGSYILYDIGASFYVDSALKQTFDMNMDMRVRYIVYPRICSLVAIIPLTYMFKYAEDNISLYHGRSNALGMYIGAVLAVSMIVSVIGIRIVEEGEVRSNMESPTVLNILDVLRMVKKNKPLIIFQLGNFFVGFIYIILTVLAGYYVKWNYCIDEMGVVDTGKFAHMSMLLGIVELVPFLAGTILAACLYKIVRNPINVMLRAIILIVAMGCIMLALQLSGNMAYNSDLFLAMYAFMLLGCGLTYLPGNVIAMESMDYAMWKTGKPVNAVIHTFCNLISKIQYAVSTVFISGILLAVGYGMNLDADVVLGNENGLTKGLIIVMIVVAIVFGVIGYVIYGRYPVNQKMRDKMISDLQNRREKS